MEASQFIDNLSQGLTGTSLTLLGYALASAGFITGGSDDDKEGKYDYALGNQTYALKIGNNTYSISWLSPVAMPLLVGANAFSELEEKEEWDANVLINTLASTLGSDMADSITGGGLHGKDLSKADVSLNIYAFKKAQETGEIVNICCAIGDEEVCGISYSKIVEDAKEYIKELGGFEKFAEWGLY